MADIELRLRKACENINITYVDCDVVLNKAKMRMNNKKKFSLPKFNFKIAFGTLAVATACLGIIAVPSIIKNALNNNPSESGGNNTASFDDETKAPFEPIVKEETISQSFDVDTLKSGTLEVLRKKANTRSFSAADETQEFANFVEKINTYGTPLFENINSSNTDKKNTAYSPASVFYALSMLSEVCDGDDKQAILNILGVSKEELNKNLPTLYRACNKTYVNGNDTMIGKERFDNSMWFDEKFNFNQSTLDTLSSNYFTNLFSGDFFIDNENMNNQISRYVKKSTDGTLNPNYQFDLSTTFAIINSLYFTDMWNYKNLPLEKTEETEFVQYDGTKKNVDLYATDYMSGKAKSTDTYSSMYAKTYDGFQFDFIVPRTDKGVTVDNLFNSEFLNNYFATPYVISDETNDYLTRVAFPEFKASYDGDILSSVYETYDIDPVSNFGSFATKTVEGDNDFKLSSIKHTTSVDINKDELNGASEAAIIPNKSGSSGRVDYKTTFSINSSFIYTIKDPTGIILFEGVVYNV